MHKFYRLMLVGICSALFVSTFGAHTVFQCDSAQRAAIDLILGFKLGCRSIHTAGKGTFYFVPVRFTSEL